MAPVVYEFSPWCNAFVMFENTIKGFWLGAPNLPSSYSFGLKFHQLYLTVGITWRWNKLYNNNTIVLQEDTVQNILL